MQVYLTGDTHGHLSISRLSNKNFPEGKKLTKDDLVIVLGDFGLFFHDDDKEIKLREWITKKPFQIAFVDGNHENFDIINNLPEVDFYGGKAGLYENEYGKIYHLKRGEVYNFNNKKFLTIGGALSIDKHLRQEGINYWKEELLSYSDEKKVLDTLDRLDINWNVDYVLTHTCPSSILYNIVSYNPNFAEDPTCRFLDFIEEKLNFNEWYFGHFHVDKSVSLYDRDYRCLFNDIVRVI